MSHLTGVRAIMKDIIETLSGGGDREFINLSAGNPVILPEVEQLWRDCTADLLSGPEYGEVVCRYGSSQGYAPMVTAVKDDFNQRYGLSLTERNILIAPGSQTLYFYAANAFGGYADGDGGNGGEPARTRKIILPLSPDYTGYGGISLVAGALVACEPELEIDDRNHRFKYRPDFSQLEIGEDAGCVVFSRPCNPTGNVLTDEETQKIVALASDRNVPVFVDSAYAAPYPALNFTEMKPVIGGNAIHCLSLSKAGLPGERIGIAIGDEKIIQILQSFQTNLCIHASRYGQAIAARAIASGQLADLSERIIRPHYQQKLQSLAETLDRKMPDVPWRLHRGEGSIFAWIWFQDLPISDWELYQRLKGVGVIVVPGSPFFPGLQTEWAHSKQCIRISLTATRMEIETAMERLVSVVADTYQKVAA